MFLFKKLPGYTIMELMVTLLVSSIVILFTSQIFLNVEKLVKIKGVKMDKSNELFEFYQTFNHDMENAENIDVSNSDIYFNKASINQIKYAFDPKVIIRFVNETTDTFKIEFSDLNINRDPIIGCISNISMNLKNEDIIHPVEFIKKYSNAFYFNTLIITKH